MMDQPLPSARPNLLSKSPPVVRRRKSSTKQKATAEERHSAYRRLQQMIKANLDAATTTEEEDSDDGDADDESSRIATSKKTPRVLVTGLERLIRTHPIWFLPSVTDRHEVEELLRGKERGNFLVRQSGKVDTMALSIQLGTSVLHYLILQNERAKMQLECSKNTFDNVLSLIFHYSKSSDELPCTLRLPQTLQEAESRQSLTSMSLLGRDFWRYPMSNPSSERHYTPDNPASSPSSAKRNQVAATPIYAESSKWRGNVRNESAEQGNHRRRSFVDELLPSHQQALFDHQSSLVRAQKGFLDARWPPMPSAPAPAPAPSSSKQEPRQCSNNALDDSLLGLQEVSDLLEESLVEIQSSRSKRVPPPTPPPRSASHASPIQSPSIKPRRRRFSSQDKHHVERKVEEDDDGEITFQARLSQAGVQQQKVSALSSPVRQRRKKSSPAAINFLNDVTRTSFSKEDSKKNRVKSGSDVDKEDVVLIRPPPYYKSNIADKMSDYEDIWQHDSSLHRRHSRPITPAESEIKFKEYLANKLNGQPTNNNSNSSNSSTSSSGNLSKMSTTSTISSGSSSSSNNSYNGAKELSKQSKDLPSDSLKQRKTSVIGFSGELVQEPEQQESQEARRSSSFSSPNSKNPIYSDPLDALEKAEDTRIYHCPEFGEIKEEEEDEESTSESCNTDVQKDKRHSDINMNWQQEDPDSLHKTGCEGVIYRFSQLEDAKGRTSPEDDLRESELSSGGDVGCSLTRMRKQVTTNSGSIQRRRENRLSAVIGRYIRPPRSSGTSAATRNSWQVDSSSWEFLGQDNDADVSSSSSGGGSSGNSDDEDPSTTTSSVIEVANGEECPYDNLKSGVEESEESKDSLYESGGNDDTLSGERKKATAPLAGDEDDEDDEDEGNKSAEEEEDAATGLPHSLPRSSAACARVGECVRRLANASSSDATIFGRSVAKFVVCTEESREKDPAVVVRNVRQFISGMKNYLIRNGEGDLHAVIEDERKKLAADEVLHVDSVLEEELQSLVNEPLKEHLTRLFRQDHTRSGCLQILSAVMQPMQESLAAFEDPTAAPALTAAAEKAAERLTRLRAAHSPVDKLDKLLATVRIILNSSACPSSRSVSVEELTSLLASVLIRCRCDWIEMESELMWGLLHPSLLAGEGGYYLTLLSSTIHFIKSLHHNHQDEAKRHEATSSVDSEQKTTAASSVTSHSGTGQRSHMGSLAGGASLTSNNSFGSTNTTSSSVLSGCSLRVLIPPETRGSRNGGGSILSKSFPLKPNMTVREVTRMIAGRTRLAANPEDYALYLLEGGKEMLLSECQKPYAVRQESLGRRIGEVSSSLTKLQQQPVYFVYKRRDAAIIWPKEFL